MVPPPTAAAAARLPTTAPDRVDELARDVRVSGIEGTDVVGRGDARHRGGDRGIRRRGPAEPFAQDHGTRVCGGIRAVLGDSLLGVEVAAFEQQGRSGDHRDEPENGKHQDLAALSWLRTAGCSFISTSGSRLLRAVGAACDQRVGTDEFDRLGGACRRTVTPLGNRMFEINGVIGRNVVWKVTIATQINGQWVAHGVRRIVGVRGRPAKRDGDVGRRSRRSPPGRSHAG